MKDEKALPEITSVGELSDDSLRKIEQLAGDCAGGNATRADVLAVLRAVSREQMKHSYNDLGLAVMGCMSALDDIEKMYDPDDDFSLYRHIHQYDKDGAKELRENVNRLKIRLQIIAAFLDMG